MTLSLLSVSNSPSQLNFQQINDELVKLRKSSAFAITPTLPATGQLWYDTTTDSLKYFNNAKTAVAVGTGGGTVTSVALSGGTTGLTVSGSPITGAGTITLAGTLAVANGGTGSTTLTGMLIGNGTSAFTTATYTAATTYTPTWTSSGTAVALGNGTLTGHYLKIGKLVFYSISLVAGSTTTFGTGTYNFALPVAAATVPSRYPMGTAEVLGANTTAYPGQAVAHSMMNALTLDGTGDYVDIGNAASLQTISTLSIEAWVYLNSVSGQRNIVGKDISGSRGYTFRISSGKIQIEKNGSSTYTAATTLATGTWYHVAVVADNVVGANQDFRLYLNGVLDGTSLASPKLALSTANTYIGRRPYVGAEEYFNGMIDELRIFNTALTAAEVLRHYSTGEGSADTGLVAGYHFNESGTAAPQDYSGNANHGTLQGDATYANSGTSVTSVGAWVWNTAGTYGTSQQVGTTVPITLGTSDRITMSGCYESAA